MAADQVNADSLGEEWLEVAKGLLFRAGRIFDNRVKDKERAEKVYEKLVALDAKDEVGWSALEEVRRGLGKFEAIVEMLLERSEAAGSNEERARGAGPRSAGSCATELDDVDQALVAFARALCERPLEEDYAREIERLAGSNPERWKETLDAIAEGSKHEALSVTERNALLGWAGRWYDQRLGRADTALLAYQQILATDPANEAASEGLASIYRRAQQWPELAALLLSLSDASVTPVEGALIGKRRRPSSSETKLNDVARARDPLPQPSSRTTRVTRRRGTRSRGSPSGRGTSTRSWCGSSDGRRRGEGRSGPPCSRDWPQCSRIKRPISPKRRGVTRRSSRSSIVEPRCPEGARPDLHNRTGRYKELLDNLERQVDAAATPRQKITLWERIAALHDEEFLNHENAAFALESLLAIDPTHDAALTSLARHYRALDRWDDVAKLLARHATAVGEGARRIDLLAARARVLADQIGSPEPGDAGVRAGAPSSRRITPAPSRRSLTSAK